MYIYNYIWIYREKESARERCKSLRDDSRPSTQSPGATRLHDAYECLLQAEQDLIWMFPTFLSQNRPKHTMILTVGTKRALEFWKLPFGAGGEQLRSMLYFPTYSSYSYHLPQVYLKRMLEIFRPEADSKKVEHGYTMIDAGLPSAFCLGISGGSCSSFWNPLCIMKASLSCTPIFCMQ